MWQNYKIRYYSKVTSHFISYMWLQTLAKDRKTNWTYSYKVFDYKHFFTLIKRGRILFEFIGPWVELVVKNCYFRSKVREGLLHKGSPVSHKHSLGLLQALSLWFGQAQYGWHLLQLGPLHPGSQMQRFWPAKLAHLPFSPQPPLEWKHKRVW